MSPTETPIGASQIKPVKKDAEGPFKSRSTIIFLGCRFGLLYLNCLCWVAGFFSEAIALVSIYLMRDIMLGVMGHQKAEDPNTKTT